MLTLVLYELLVQDVKENVQRFSLDDLLNNYRNAIFICRKTGLFYLLNGKHMYFSNY